jgi:hypothetical protein
MGYLVGLERVLNEPILVWPLPMLERLLGDCQSCTICWIFCISLPLLVASSNRGVSTEAAGRWTYLTTLPLMKTFFTELCCDGAFRQRICSLLCSYPVSCHTM